MLWTGANRYIRQKLMQPAKVIDYLRFNSFFAAQIYEEQPLSAWDQLNRLEYRPLEGFIIYNFTFQFHGNCLKPEYVSCSYGQYHCMEACLNLTSFKLDIDEDIYGSRSPRGSYKLCARVWNRNKQNCAFKSKSCRHTLYRIKFYF